MLYLCYSKHCKPKILVHYLLGKWKVIYYELRVRRITNGRKTSTEQPQTHKLDFRAGGKMRRQNGLGKGEHNLLFNHLPHLQSTYSGVSY